jgi:hypothetical protein
MRKRKAFITILSVLLASGAKSAWAAGITESKTPESLGLIGVLFLVGLVQILLFAKHRNQTNGTLALLCAGMLVAWIVREDFWPSSASFKAITYAGIVPLLLIYVQSLYPRRWLGAMIDFTWAYVIPYAVIILVYPPEQLVPIMPAMEKFSFLSLATTLVTAAEARRERQPCALALLFTLVCLFVGLMLADLRAYALGSFTVAQVWIVSRVGRTPP